MKVSGYRRQSLQSVQCLWIVMTGAAAGCCAPSICAPGGLSSVPIQSANSQLSAAVVASPPGVVVVDSPRSDSSTSEARTPSAVETWIVHTRACEQTMGSNPWPSITVGRLDEFGGPLHGTDPEALISRIAGRTTIFLIHGAGYSHKSAVDEAVNVRALLESVGGLPTETVFIVFDWPSEIRNLNLISDLNEDSRRSRIASYHLARFIQATPPGSRLCLMGQSDGGRIVLTTLHLLSGAVLPAFWAEPPVQLTSGRPDPHVRAVILDAAAGHHWLNPNERLGQALPSCEALLNLRNSGDLVLALYPLGVYTGLRPAIGLVGLRPHDLRSVGPLSNRVEQHDLHATQGTRHTTFPQVFESPGIPDRIACYTSWGPVAPALSR
jgi:predicted esterase